MKLKRKLREGGVLLAAGLLLSQLGVFPALATELTGKDMSKCDYVMDTTGTILQQGTPLEYSCALIGVPENETPTQVWVKFGIDASQGLPTMPAFGYSAPGCGEYDWYQDGLWMESPSSSATVIFDVSEEYPMPDTFQLQLWGTEGESLSEVEVKAVGIYVDGSHAGQSVTPGTKKGAGDINEDGTADRKDIDLLSGYLLKGETGTVFNNTNADLSQNSILNSTDLTLLKRGIMDGSLNKQPSDPLPENESAMEFVSHIKVGWNLGNTLDATPTRYSSPTQAETSWGCPLTTKEIIDCVKAQGFNLVRVPVSWGQKMDNSTYKIDEAWMNRVQEVVDYVIDNDMYCILNIHHDNTIASDHPYFYPDNSHYTQSEKFVTAVWEQVSARFGDYDNHLIFETLNEPRLVGHQYEWWLPSNSGEPGEAMANINKLNEAALNTIRSSGGKNATRFVMIPTYAASPDTVNLAGMQMPDDDHLIAEIHAYRPYDFALADNGTATWDASAGAAEINTLMNTLKQRFLSKNIPVIIDEFGARSRNNEDQRATWVKNYLETADKYGIPCVWWDNNAFSGNGELFGLINRNTLQVQYPSIMTAIQEATANRGK